jgi:hypothetical protein
VSPELKEKLDAAAEHTGRSQSTEAAVRLERSFDRQDLLSEALTLAFGKEPAGLLMMLGYVMGPSGYVALHREDRLPFNLGQWISHPAAYDQAVQGAIRVLNALRPPGEVPQSATDHGVQIADYMIRSVGGGPIDTLPKLAALPIRELLGAIADRCKDFEPGKQSEHTGTTGATERQTRLVPLLTVSQAMQLSAFKKWCPSTRFADAKRVSIRFDCGPRAFALEVFNSDELDSFKPGDLLVLDPDARPAHGNWVLATIDHRPALAIFHYGLALAVESLSNDEQGRFLDELLQVLDEAKRTNEDDASVYAKCDGVFRDRNLSREDRLLTHNSSRTHLMKLRTPLRIRAVVTEFTKRRPVDHLDASDVLSELKERRELRANRA